VVIFEVFLMAKTGFQSVDDYIASQPKAVQSILRRVRSTIRKAAPEAQETISYKMPMYMLCGSRLLHFAAWKHHYSIYAATEQVVAAFQAELVHPTRSTRAQSAFRSLSRSPSH
jgi:uncharacterized protein YdhG (YjbR/CyaY superfamily)